jgi:hypothetical protein
MKEMDKLHLEQWTYKIDWFELDILGNLQGINGNCKFEENKDQWLSSESICP